MISRMPWWQLWGWRALWAVGFLLCCGGIDCVWDGLRDLFDRAKRWHDRQVGLLVAAIGLGLLLAGGLLIWWTGGQLRRH
jgi:hypothetical protein